MKKGKLATIDFIFNKVIPKKFIVILVTMIMTWMAQVVFEKALPDAFYYTVQAYLIGSAVYHSVKVGLKQEERFE